MPKRTIIFIFFGVLLWGGVFILYYFQWNFLSSSAIPLSTSAPAPCAVVYKYQNISEKILDPSLPLLPSEENDPSSGKTFSPEEIRNMLDAVKTQQIENSVEMDFSFSQSTLQSAFINFGDNIRLIYDRDLSTVKWQFDISWKTYVCQPLQLLKDQDVFMGNACEAPKWDIITCQDDTTHSMSYECNKKEYSYILKRCVSPLTVTTSVTPSIAQINQWVTWRVSAQWGNGVYTYSWSGSDGLVGTGPSIIKAYTTSGVKNALVTVTSGNQTQTLNASATIVPPFSVSLESSSGGILETRKSNTYTTKISGGIPPYTYSWSGTDALTGNTANITKIYTTPGKKTVTVHVKSSDGQTKIITQVFDVIILKPLRVSCTPVSWIWKIWRPYTWKVSAQGGNGIYTYSWSGSDKLASKAYSVTKTYTTRWQKTATVRVTSGSSSSSATCKVTIQ
jgi:hypothetical protein